MKSISDSPILYSVTPKLAVTLSIQSIPKSNPLMIAQNFSPASIEFSIFACVAHYNYPFACTKKARI